MVLREPQSVYGKVLTLADLWAERKVFQMAFLFAAKMAVHSALQ